MPKFNGPAPNNYALPPVLGYPHHDLRKYRYPQYTMAPKFPPRGKPSGPGPRYHLEGYTRVGKATPPAYTIKSRSKPLNKFPTPGVGAYSPELAPRMKDQRPPCYTIKSRRPPLAKYITPGPKYLKPPSLGCKIPDLYTRPCYTMSPKLKSKEKQPTPGPKYQGIDMNIIKQKPPKYTMRPNVGLSQKPRSPGPKYYPKLPRCIQQSKEGWSFGLKIWQTDPYYTEEDLVPAC